MICVPFSFMYIMYLILSLPNCPLFSPSNFTNNLPSTFTSFSLNLERKHNIYLSGSIFNIISSSIFLHI